LRILLLVGTLTGWQSDIAILIKKWPVRVLRSVEFHKSLELLPDQGIAFFEPVEILRYGLSQ